MMVTAAMDFPVWFFLTSILLIAVQAGPTDQGPQMFSGAKKADPPPKQHKREPKYEMQTKEIILYLTPSQIKAFEASQGLIPHTQQTAQADLSTINEQIKEQMQNVLNEEGQKQQRKAENLEANQKQNMQLKEVIKNKLSKKSKEQQLSPINNAPQSPQVDLQKREKFIELPLQFQLYPTAVPQFEHHAFQSPNFELVPQAPTVESKSEQQEVPLALKHYEQLLPAPEPQQDHIAAQQDKTPWGPQSYAYLYFYPKGKPVNTEKLELFYPGKQEERPKQLSLQPENLPKHQPEHLPKQLSFQPEHLQKQLLIQPEHYLKHLFVQPEQLPKQLVFQQEHPIFPLHSKYQFVPYEYGYANKLEAQHILQAQLVNHELDAQRLQAYRLEPQQLEVDGQDVLAQKELEAQYLPPNQNDAQQFDAAKKLAAQQSSAEEVEKWKASEIQTDLKPPKLEESELDIKQLEAIQRQQMEEVLEAQKLKAKFEAQEKEARRLDAQLEAEQIKAEKMKEEQEHLAYLRQLEPKRTQMYSILKPLFQGHNIAESLEQQKANFPHYAISLEKGFRPLQYAPQYNDEKYVKEVEKILNKNRLEKQKAYAKAAAIANEPPEIIQSDERITKLRHMKVSAPTSGYLPIPEPFEVKVPQPYPVPLEIIRPIPIPIVKMEKVEVEKPVPVVVEKHVPVPVTKNVYVQVDKPYFVEKVVPVEVKREIPIEIPIRKPQKLSIIRHVWEH